MTPEAYLQTKGYKLRQAPGQWQTQCPFCGDTNRYGHLYVNREHGAWLCHRCGKSGSFFSLQKELGDEPTPVSKVLADKQRVWSAFVSMCEEALADAGDAVSYLHNDRGLKAATIREYRLGWVPRDAVERMVALGFTLEDLNVAGLINENRSILFWDRVLIPYFDADRVTAVRAKKIGGNILQAKDSSIRLFGIDNIKSRKEVFLCEGELDAVYLSQLGYAACAIPGANSFQEHWVSYFDGATRVFIVLDADDAGHKGALKTEHMLGKRSRIVDLPVPSTEDSADITEFFLRDAHTKDDFEALVEGVRGRRVFSLEEAFAERDRLDRTEGVQTGWKDLDDLIRPGLLPGQVVTVLAKTGTGKTAFLTQVLHNMSSYQVPHGPSGPGVPALVLSLEQTKAEFGERIRRIGLLHNPVAERRDIAMWHSQMRINDENRLPASDMSAIIEEFIDDVGVEPRVIVIDYLGYWARSFKGGSNYEKVTEAVMELKRLAKDANAVVISPHQVSRLQKRGEVLELDHARDSGAVEETSDFVIGMFKPKEIPSDDPDNPTDWAELADVRLQLLKSRHGNQGRQARMLWSPYSLALSSIGAGPIYERTKAEWEYFSYEATYEEVLLKHRRLVDEESLL